MTQNPASSGTKFAFSAVTTLFFMWGFITCMNDLLIPKFKTDFDLNQFQANTVQFAFFGAYFLVSLLYFLISASKGDPINKIGYQNGLVLGLVIAGIGCFMFYPAAQIYQFWLFLAALGVLGAGVTIIQIAANPYVTILGPERSGSSRLNLAQGFCSLGYVIAPFIGGILIFGSEVFEGTPVEPAVATETIGLVETLVTETEKTTLTGEDATKALEKTKAVLTDAKAKGLDMPMANELRELSMTLVEAQQEAGLATPLAEESQSKANEIIRGLQLAELDSLKAPYLGLGAAFLIIAAVFKMISLPSFTQEGKIEPGITAFKHKHFVWGWLAIFFYVGSEVTIGSILVNYLGDPSVANLPENEADKYLSFCWGGLMIGRLMGAISLGDMKESKKLPYMILAAVISTGIIYTCATFKQLLTVGEHINPMDILPFIGLIALSFIFFKLGKSSAGRMVGLFALVAAALTVFSMSTSGSYALWSILGIGLFNSIMWSNIFSLSIKGLGKDTSQGSSLLVMMIVGGALMPLAQGWLTDSYGIRASLGIVLLGYVYLVWYGFFAPKAMDTEEDITPVAAGH
ncbi:sugar MFS transporter [Haloferula sp.]|uniref:sugar MFS transporter n=1 Tax=Haloferula sp. TaxID=2497595 RepID=UPI003C75E9AB